MVSTAAGTATDGTDREEDNGAPGWASTYRAGAPAGRSPTEPRRVRSHPLAQAPAAFGQLCALGHPVAGAGVRSVAGAVIPRTWAAVRPPRAGTPGGVGATAAAGTGTGAGAGTGTGGAGTGAGCGTGAIGCWTAAGIG